MCFYMNTQTGSEWSQGLLLPMTVMLTTGAFIKSAVPGREKEGERKDWCEYGASRDGCKMKDGRDEANTLLRSSWVKGRTRRTKQTFVLSIKRMCQLGLSNWLKNYIRMFYQNIIKIRIIFKLKGMNLVRKKKLLASLLRPQEGASSKILPNAHFFKVGQWAKINISVFLSWFAVYISRHFVFGLNK